MQVEADSAFLSIVLRIDSTIIKWRGQSTYKVLQVKSLGMKGFEVSTQLWQLMQSVMFKGSNKQSMMLEVMG